MPHCDSQRFVILLYAVEVLIAHVAGRELVFRCVVITALALLSLKSIVSVPVV
jgi:hypothetical protein